MLPVLTLTVLLYLYTMLATLAKAIPAPADLWGSSDINQRTYDSTQVDSTTKQGPVLFPNDAPPPPRPPLIVTARPLAESIARSELNTSVKFNSSPTPSNVYYTTAKPQFVLKQKYKSVCDSTKSGCGGKPLKPEGESRTLAVTLSGQELGDYVDDKKIIAAEKRSDRDQQFLGNAPNENNDYAFSYTVRDQASGDDFSHRQQSRGVTTDGEYRVQLPDGRVQIVSYKADKNGYKADVRYKSNNKHYDVVGKHNNNPNNRDQNVTPKISLFETDYSLLNKYKNIVNDLVAYTKMYNKSKAIVPTTNNKNDHKIVHSLYDAYSHNTKYPNYKTQKPDSLRKNIFHNNYDFEKYNNNLTEPRISKTTKRIAPMHNDFSNVSPPGTPKTFLNSRYDQNTQNENENDYNYILRDTKHLDNKFRHTNSHLLTPPKPDNQRHEYYDNYIFNNSPKYSVSAQTQESKETEESLDSKNQFINNVLSLPPPKLRYEYDYSEFVTTPKTTPTKINTDYTVSHLVSQYENSPRTPTHVKLSQEPNAKHKSEQVDIDLYHPSPWLPDYNDIVHNSPDPLRLDYHDVTPQLFPGLEDAADQFKAKLDESLKHNNNYPTNPTKTVNSASSTFSDYRDILSEKLAAGYENPRYEFKSQTKSITPPAIEKKPSPPYYRTKTIFSNVYDRSESNQNAVSGTTTPKYGITGSPHPKYGPIKSFRPPYDFKSSVIKPQTYVPKNPQVTIYTPTANLKKIALSTNKAHEPEVYVTPPNRFISPVYQTVPTDEYVEKFSNFDMKLRLDPAVLNEYNDASPQKYVKVKHNANSLTKESNQENSDFCFDCIAQPSGDCDDSKNKVDYDYISGDFASTPFKDYNFQYNQLSREVYNNDYSFEEDHKHFSYPLHRSKFTGFHTKNKNSMAENKTPVEATGSNFNKGIENRIHKGIFKAPELSKTPKIEINHYSTSSLPWADYTTNNSTATIDSSTILSKNKIDDLVNSNPKQGITYTQSEFEPWDYDHDFVSNNEMKPDAKNTYFKPRTTSMNIEIDPNSKITNTPAKETVVITPRPITSNTYTTSPHKYEGTATDVVNITPKSYLETTIYELRNRHYAKPVQNNNFKSRIYNLLKDV